MAAPRFNFPLGPARAPWVLLGVARAWWSRLRARLARFFGGPPPADADTPLPPPQEGPGGAPTSQEHPEIVKAEPGEVPAWAEPLGTAARLDRFERAVLADLRGRQIAATPREGVVVPEGVWEGHAWGLANLARLCAAVPEGGWASVIAHHFDLTLRVAEQEGRLGRELRDYASARKRLVPRLWEEDACGPLLDHAVCRRDLPGLVTVLSIDLPDSIRAVTPEMLAGWGVGEDQAFARAFDNLEPLAQPRVTPVELGDGQRIFEVRGSSYYTASMALRLDAMPRLVGAHGAFIAIPTRHTLLSLPFTGAGTMEKLHVLLRVARAAERQGPGSLSHRVFWHHADRWHEVTFEVAPGSITLMPPVELLEYLRGLDDPPGFEPVDEDPTGP